MQLPPSQRILDPPEEHLSDEAMHAYERSEMKRWKKEWVDGGLYPPSEWGNDSDTWVGAKFLGEGSYGSAGLWVKKDRRGNVVDQVVCKDVMSSDQDWRDPNLWRQGFPREIAIHRVIDNERANHHPRVYRSLMKHRGYRLHMVQQRYRLYVEYLPKGDLEVSVRDRLLLMMGKREWNEKRWRLRTKRPMPPFKDILPEKFLWHVFRELVNAVMVLRHGHQDDEKYPKHWRPIVHRDIGMSNVFLDDRKPDDEFHESVSNHEFLRIKGEVS